MYFPDMLNLTKEELRKIRKVSVRVWFYRLEIEKEMAAIFNQLAHRLRLETVATVRRIFGMQGEELSVQPCDKGWHEDWRRFRSCIS
jgi:hypothetical protein